MKHARTVTVTDKHGTDFSAVMGVLFDWHEVVDEVGDELRVAATSDSGDYDNALVSRDESLSDLMMLWQTSLIDHGFMAGYNHHAGVAGYSVAKAWPDGDVLTDVLQDTEHNRFRFNSVCAVLELSYEVDWDEEAESDDDEEGTAPMFWARAIAEDLDDPKMVQFIYESEPVGIDVSSGYSTLSGDEGQTKLVMIDTTEETGRIRILLNDGPVWEGDPMEGQSRLPEKMARHDPPRLYVSAELDSEEADFGNDAGQILANVYVEQRPADQGNPAETVVVVDFSENLTGVAAIVTNGERVHEVQTW